MPPDVYVASLARKRMAAGALYRDGSGKVLLVDPVYRDTWDLPGGAVEAEHPIGPSAKLPCSRQDRITRVLRPEDGERGA